VPTIGEYLPGAQVNDGLGIWPAAGTPEPVVAPLRAEINHGWRCPMSESVSLGGRRRAPIATREVFAAANARYSTIAVTTDD